MKAKIFEERTSVYEPLAASEKQGKPWQEKVTNTANNTEKTSESHQKLTRESRPRTQLLGRIPAVSFSRENHRKELRKNWDSRYGDAAAARFEPILGAVSEPRNRCWAQWIGAHAGDKELVFFWNLDFGDGSAIWTGWSPCGDKRSMIFDMLGSNQCNGAQEGEDRTLVV
ncbi:hypothetical protein FF1_036720 [Malus domestica]